MTNDSELVLAPTLTVINQVKDEGIITDYVIGGSMAILYYAEPFFTKDLDLFIQVAPGTLLLDLGPIWRRLQELGGNVSGISVIVNGVPVEFLAADTPLIREAFDNASTIKIEGVTTKIFRLEYAMAIKIQPGRAKDWGHIEIAMETAEPDRSKLEDILKRFDLFEVWRKHGYG